MKKILALLLAVIMCVSLCACRGKNDNSSKDWGPEDHVRESARAYVITYAIAAYGVAPGVDVTCSVDHLSGDTYKVSGKITARKDGATYKGSFSGTVEYYPSTNDCDVDIELSDLYKDS